MNKSIVVIGLLLALLNSSQSAWAEAKNGLGIYIGGAFHTMSGTVDLIGNVEASSSGFSLGIDYQFALVDTASLGLFVLSSSEFYNSTLDVEWTYSSHVIYGIQYRFWISEIFLGVHVGKYTEVLSDNLDNSIAGSGNGAGITVGWEGEKGFFLAIQADTATIVYPDTEFKVIGVRLHVGRRLY